MTHDRRSFLRLNIAVPLTVESVLHGTVTCLARNISEGGVFLETQTLLPLGSLIRIWFAGAHGERALCLLGTVRNHYSLDYGDGGQYRRMVGMGVRFRELGSAAEEAVLGRVLASDSPRGTALVH
ncbi:MAG: PilZ domain-containing protein [Deltaproteobacteria bacterium]|nr:PilZ domain-containing protein [Deltaproteobacteria bacterium]